MFLSLSHCYSRWLLQTEVHVLFILNLLIQAAGLWHSYKRSHEQVWSLRARKQVLCESWFCHWGLLCPWHRHHPQLHPYGHPELHRCHLCLPVDRWRGEGGPDRIQEGSISNSGVRTWLITCDWFDLTEWVNMIIMSICSPQSLCYKPSFYVNRS